MEPSDFPGNAKASREKDVKKPAPKSEKPKVEKVVKGEAVKLKRGFGTRFKEVFLGSDAKSATRYITTDVLLPALRNLIVDATSKGIERLIYGDTIRRGRGGREEYGRPRVQYNNPLSRYSGRPGPMLPDQPPLPDRRTRGAEDIVLVSREEAETVIERLTDIVDQYEVASVADLYDLVGLPTTYVDNKWGWTNLSYASVRQIREGYLLDLPRAEPI
jgi:hypothetical protein